MDKPRSKKGSAGSKGHSNVMKRLIMVLHRDLGFFFAGMILIYAISGILMNHRNVINPNYSVEIIESKLPKTFPWSQSKVTDADVTLLAQTTPEVDNLIKHYFSKGNLKLLFRGGSSLTANLKDRTVVYEKISRRFLISDMVRLHYNPGSWWSYFSDIFAVCLIIIDLTGLFIISGKKGIMGCGGLLLISGIIIPIIFLLL